MLEIYTPPNLSNKHLNTLKKIKSHDLASNIHSSKNKTKTYI